MVTDLLTRLERLEHLVLMVCFIVLLLALSMGSLRYFFHRFPKSSRLHLATRANAYGIVFGWAAPGVVAYSPCAAEGHIAVIGGSGFGKTSALLIPTLRSWQGPALAIDISGDICKNVSGNKIVYAPLEQGGVCYNPFYRIDALNDQDDQDEALEQLAYLLMPRPVKKSDASEFFTSEGRKILIAALLSGYHSGKDFSEICQAVVKLGWKDLFSLIDRSKYPPASSYIQPFEGASEKNTAGCKQAVDEAIGLFARNRHVRESLHRPSPGEHCFSPPDLEHHKVFVIVPDEALEQLAPLLRLVTAQTLEYISTRPLDATETILLALDEFSSLGSLDILPALRKSRKRHTRIMVLTQSLSDLELTYGKEARGSMMSNFAYKAILDVADAEGQETFAKLIGRHDATKETHSIPGGFASGNRTITTEQRYIIEPDKLDNLGNSLILLHPGGYTKLRKSYYFKSF